MKIIAKAKYLRGSPRKVRLVAKLAKGLPADRAIAGLKQVRRQSAQPIIKLIQQGIANAQNNFKINEAGKLVVSRLEVGEGPRMKRRDRFHGARFDSGIIQKKFYHLSLILESKEESNQIKETKKVISEPKTVKKIRGQNGK